MPLVLFRYVLPFVLAHASVDADRALLDGPLTPSAWLVRGDDVAIRVITARPGDCEPWLEFQSDPRHLGTKVTQPENALGAAMHYDPQYLDWMNQFRRLAREGRVTLPRFFITWHALGVRPINRLTSQRIYVVGLIDQAIRVDGKARDAARFLAHDLDHARETEGLITTGRFHDDVVAKRRAVRNFHRHFDYARETRLLSLREHVLFDVGYVLYFREGFARPTWNFRFAHVAVAPLDQRLAEIDDTYRIFDRYAVSILPDQVARVRLNDKSDPIVARFLDPGDLRVNLPRELKRALTSHRNPQRLVRAFVEEALSVFFTAHYRHARERIGIEP